MAVGEWDQRQLCSDGGCVGVIGPDGTCKVCGRAAQNWGDERKRGLIDPPEEHAEADELAAAAEADAEAKAFEHDEDDELDDDELEDDGIDDLDDEDDDLDEDDEDDEDDDLEDAAGASIAAPASAAVVAAPVEWGTRQLCPDGACIGVLGDDGHCKVCGRRASGTSPATASGTADSGFAIVTTDDAVATTDDAVQTVASTITTDEADPGTDLPTAPDGSRRAPEPAADPDSKDPA